MRKVIAWSSMLTVVGCLIYGASVSAVDVTDKTVAAIVAKCDSIKESLTTLQHNDSRTRVYLGRRYETVLMNYITPLNVSLVQSGLSTADFITNQNNYAKSRENFVIDYIEYQKSLEELTLLNCKSEPERFYDKLETTRRKRKLVAEDVAKMRKLTSEQIELTRKLEGEI